MTDTQENKMSVSVDHSKRRINFSHWGVLDKRSAIRSFYLVNEVEGFSPEYGTLADFRDISEVAIGFNELKEILSEAKAIERRTGRAALVVGGDMGRLTFAKLLCTLSESFAGLTVTFQAFKTKEDAETWLDS